MGNNKDKTAAFSGHRTYKMKMGQRSLFQGNDMDGSENLSARIEAEITNLILKGYDTFMCGMAEGFDLMAAEAVITLREQYSNIRLIAVIPYPGQADTFNKKSKTTYEKVLTEADETTIICDRYLPECYHLRNNYMIDNSSALICYYNESKGGTEYTVKKAIKNGLDIINTF